MALFHTLLNKAVAYPRFVFLADGIGALLTAFLTGVVLTRLDSLFAMPHEILHRLALAACGFAVYSLTCSALNVKAWQGFLSVVAVANALYCFVTLGLTVSLFKSVSAYDVAYFLGEIVVIGIVAGVEFSIIRYSRQNFA